MTEQVQELTPLQLIEREQDRLSGGRLALRMRVQERLRGVGGTPAQVASMLTTLGIPALHLSTAQAMEQALADARWDGDIADYTESGLRKQAELMQEKTAQWFVTLRTELGRLVSARLIRQDEADTALQALGAPAAPVPAPAPRVTVTFRISGTAWCPVSEVDGDDEHVRHTAVEDLQNAIRETAENHEFTVDDAGFTVEVTVSRTGA